MLLLEVGGAERVAVCRSAATILSDRVNLVDHLRIFLVLNYFVVYTLSGGVFSFRFLSGHDHLLHVVEAEARLVIIVQ